MSCYVQDAPIEVQRLSVYGTTYKQKHIKNLDLGAPAKHENLARSSPNVFLDS